MNLRVYRTTVIALFLSLMIIKYHCVHSLDSSILDSDLDLSPRNSRSLTESDPAEDELECSRSGLSEQERQSFLWTLRRDPPSYFFGTVHVPYSRVWRHIPQNVKHAFHRSNTVYFELDLTNQHTVSSLAACQLLPRGEYLSNILPPALYARLKRHLDYVRDVMPTWMTSHQRGRGLYADYLFNAITGNWERKRPVWIMLMVNSLTESDVRARGRAVLDLYLAQEAKRLGKYLGSVEEVEEQCLPLNNLDMTLVLFALNQTLTRHERLRDSDSSAAAASGPPRHSTDRLIQQYNCGHLNDILISHDTAQVPNLILQLNNNLSLPHSDLVTALRIERYFRRELIDKRNERMAQRIARLLKNHPNQSFFFAFGAGHFIGNHTVIDILREKDHLIEQTPPDAHIYTGAGYEARDYPPLLADYVSESELPSVFIHTDLDTLDPIPRRKTRHKHKNNGRGRGRKRDRGRSLDDLTPPPAANYGPSEPKFNDLWIRFQDSNFNLMTSQDKVERSTEGAPTRQKQYILYSGTAEHSCKTFVILILVLVHCVITY